jgi:PTH1 family peptidyl-tRNA hydrolase
LDALPGAASMPWRARTSQHAEVCRVPLWGHDCILARPTVFMNESGRAVRAVLDYFRVPVSRLVIAYDELDLPPGDVRLKQGGGHGGHNGLRDVFRHVDDRGFLRLRIGIGHPGHKDRVVGYVLGRPDTADERLIRDAIERGVDVLPRVLDDDVQGAMTALHTRD